GTSSYQTVANSAAGTQRLGLYLVSNTSSNIMLNNPGTPFPTATPFSVLGGNPTNAMVPLSLTADVSQAFYSFRQANPGTSSTVKNTIHVLTSLQDSGNEAGNLTFYLNDKISLGSFALGYSGGTDAVITVVDPFVQPIGNPVVPPATTPTTQTPTL